MAYGCKPVCAMERKTTYERGRRLCDSRRSKLDAYVGRQTDRRNVGYAVCDVRHNVGKDGKMEGILEGRNACDIDNDAYTKCKWFATFVLLHIRFCVFVFKI